MTKNLGWRVNLRRTGWLGLASLLVLASCAHAPPQLVQVFGQVNWVYDPGTRVWDQRLSAFVQASSADGTAVFDRLHILHDDQGLFVTLGSAQWTVVDRPGEHWVGTNGITFADGRVPPGTWRVVLVTKAGQQVEGSFAVAPRSPGQAPPRWGPVTLVEAPSARTYRVSGWVDDYLVWARDVGGKVISRNKTVGDRFTVPPGTVSVVLYTYDASRAVGRQAGPFSLKVVR
jgi:hypothetical protein